LGRLINKFHEKDNLFQTRSRDIKSLTEKYRLWLYFE
jgi:hypothetical protein